MAHAPQRRSRSQREAEEYAQMLLGLVSLVVWFVVAFGLAIAMHVDDDHPRQIMLAGGIGLAVAALPWLGYRALVDAARRNR